MDDFREPEAVARLLDGLPCPWGFCGGWAVDLFLGRVTRPHKDVDVAIARKDQLLLQSFLCSRGWSLEKAHQGRLSPWPAGERIDLPVHGVWCRKPGERPDLLEVLLNECRGDDFAFRRAPSIVREGALAWVRGRGGLPLMAPEIVLLYKSDRPDDAPAAADFAATLPALDPGQRRWLREALVRLRPDHPWLPCLARGS